MHILYLLSCAARGGRGRARVTRITKHAKRRRQHGATYVEYLVVVTITMGVMSASIGLTMAMARNAMRADAVLNSNSP